MAQLFKRIFVFHINEIAADSEEHKHNNHHSIWYFYEFLYKIEPIGLSKVILDRAHILQLCQPNFRLTKNTMKNPHHVSEKGSLDNEQTQKNDIW